MFAVVTIGFLLGAGIGRGTLGLRKDSRVLGGFEGFLGGIRSGIWLEAE